MQEISKIAQQNCTYSFLLLPLKVRANITANIAYTILHLNSEPWLLKSGLTAILSWEESF